MTKQYRIEKDSCGEVYVPQDAYYGAQTQRAVQNFPVSGIKIPSALISALGQIKAACAKVNQALGLIAPERAEAIIKAAELVASNEYDNQFPVDIFQTGSGTSSNMNANEVIAYLAYKSLGQKIHANDEVNCSQSSNDVFPSAIRVAATISIKKQLLPAITYLITHIEKRAKEYKDIVKTGRTHLMDAMPLTLGQELQTWNSQLQHAYAAIERSLESMRALPIGGTAIGSGINAPLHFGKKVCAKLTETTGFRFESMDNNFAGIAGQDALVEMSGQLKMLASILLKVSNDLRWMNSGPYAGLAEITLPTLQPGSSIMPGKVNPVIPEAVAMVAVQVMGYDVAISQAGASGNFQLNVMLPLMGYNLLQSIKILSNGCRLLADKAIKDFTVNEKTILKNMEKNPILITALNKHIGYEKGALIVKKAYEEKRSLFDVAKEVTGYSEEKLRTMLNPMQLTQGGIIE